MFSLQNSETDTHSEKFDLLNTEKALLNILDDYSGEKYLSDSMQKALLNILEDFGAEKANMEKTQRAVLNILDDYSQEKYHSENTQRALLNILEDFGAEKTNMEKTQRAILNILDDYSQEKYHSENTQKALLNILEDFGAEKTNMENTQRAVLNILDDYSQEKYHSENTQKALLNILDDYSEEKLNLEKTQSAVLNILDDYSEEKKKVEIINTDLISANKELEQFAYAASHDLQEPLRTIANYVGLLEKTYSGKTNEDTELYFKFVLTATSKMQNLIKDLLDFSRVGRNISFADVDCNKILKETIADLDLSIKESNAKITSAILPVLLGNGTELKRLFQNLISNAIKFRKKNVIPEIAIRVEEKDTEYFFSIMDNGIGIEEQYFAKLFIIFQRLHNVEEYPGTGIGLATCKKIVTLHKGKIWVESKFGEGSTFYFTISKEI